MYELQRDILLNVLNVHIIGHFGGGFFASNDQTNSVKALKKV